jgi:hypothetical protein
LSCGLDLPHVAVLSTAFGFVLIYILDAKIIYHIDVMMMTSEIVGPAAKAYRELLEQHGCRVLSEKKNPVKRRIRLIFTDSGQLNLDQLQDLLETKIDPELKGTVNWEVD